MTKKIALFALVVGSALVSIGACSSSSSGPSATTDAGNGTSDAPVSTTDEASSADASIQPNTWTWISVPGAKCRDGSDTGIGVNINPASTKLMIFMEGGGACFNKTTCDGNPSKYAESDFTAAVAAGGAAGFNGTFDTMHTNGIMSRGDAMNPVKDYNMVYIPYCTGDVHGGGNPGGTPPGEAAQQFVGYSNVKLDLDVIKSTFTGTTDVLLAGMSGGGFGVLVNYDQVATFFGTVPVTMIDDSGPPMADPYLPSCLQTQVSTLWGLDKTVLADCGPDCAGDSGALDPSHFAINLMIHLAKKYPNRVLGVMDSTADNTISSFFGFGASDCTSFSPELEGTFTAGLLDIRTQLAFDTNFGTFIFKGPDHTSTEGQLDTRIAGGTVDGGASQEPLADWLTKMIAGTATNAGP